MTTNQIVECLTGRLDEMRRRFSVDRLALFGSAARDEIGGDSDIDILVTFQGTSTFDAFMDLKFYLEDLLQKPVDLVTDKALRPQIRRAIEGERIDVA
ncbi:MAG: nucleotidyltransferase family protein [Planctomycetota bacterium]